MDDIRLTKLNYRTNVGRSIGKDYPRSTSIDQIDNVLKGPCEKDKELTSMHACSD